MEFYFKILLMGGIGFVIGYFTNYLAVKMLFYPRKRVFGVQGVIPKRKREIAKSIGEVSPALLPSQLREVEKIPFVGEKAIRIIKRSVESQVNSLSEEELEKIILTVVKKELNFISLIGGFIGLIIGLLQSVVLII